MRSSLPDRTSDRMGYVCAIRREPGANLSEMMAAAVVGEAGARCSFFSLAYDAARWGLAQILTGAVWRETQHRPEIAC